MKELLSSIRFKVVCVKTDAIRCLKSLGDVKLWKSIVNRSERLRSETRTRFNFHKLGFGGLALHPILTEHDMFGFFKQWNAPKPPEQTMEIEVCSPRISRARTSINTDRPVTKMTDDKLGRSYFSKVIANQIAESPSDESYVIGLTGPWGFGKTSILNMVEQELLAGSSAYVVWFNPWMFSGTEQLLTQFFRELSAQLGSKGVAALKALGEQIQTYGTLLSPITSFPLLRPMVGDVKGYVDATSDLLKGLPDKTSSVFEQRKKIEKLLQKVDRTIVVFIDDIDRLRQDEVRDVMKLVRLTADFPNVVYVLSFDRLRVEKALDEGQGDGRAYLEKILQVSFDVPQLRSSQIQQLLLNELEGTVKGRQSGPLHSNDWQNYFHMGILPMVTNLRDVRRYVNSLPVAMSLLGEEVALSDVLAMEAIRVFCPRSFTMLPEIHGALTDSKNSDRGTETEKRTDQLKIFFECSGEREKSLRSLTRSLFPCSQRYTDNTSFGSDWLRQWRTNGRVAHPEILRFYLEKSYPSDQLPVKTVRDFFESFSDGSKLEKLISEMSEEQFESAVSRVLDYQEKFTEVMAEVAIPILLNNLSKTRDGKRYMFDFGGALTIRAAAYGLLRRVEDEAVRIRIVQDNLAKISSFSSRIVLLDLAGHKEGVGHKLISQEVAEAMEAEILDGVASAPIEELKAEKDLPSLLLAASKRKPEDKAIVLKRIADDGELFLRILRASLSTAFSSTIGEAAETRTEVLPWPGLIELIGEDLLVQKVSSAFDRLESIADVRTRTAVEVAKKYVTGERTAGWQIDDDDE